MSVECLSPKKNTVFYCRLPRLRNGIKHCDGPTRQRAGRVRGCPVRRGPNVDPAPAVLAAGKVPLPAPFALFERVAGRTVDNLSPVSTTLRGVSATVGRHLTTLHAAETFDDAGPLVAGLDGLQPADVTSEWPSVFEQTLRAKVDDLPLAFDAHADTGDTAVAWVTTNPGWCGDCVPTHLDHRPANLVLRPRDGVDGRAAGGASEDSGTGDGANRVVAVLD